MMRICEKTKKPANLDQGWLKPMFYSKKSLFYCFFLMFFGGGGGGFG